MPLKIKRGSEYNVRVYSDNTDAERQLYITQLRVPEHFDTRDLPYPTRPEKALAYAEDVLKVKTGLSAWVDFPQNTNIGQFLYCNSPQLVQITEPRVVVTPETRQGLKRKLEF